MAHNMFRLIIKVLPQIFTLTFSTLVHYLRSKIHHLTYKPITNALNVVIIGGSFTGSQLAKRLANSLPSGYRVILIEKNTHLNYTFNFPRYSVLRGREQKAFIPYSGLLKSVSKGALEIVKGEVKVVEDGRVVLMSGEVVKFEFLAIATGSMEDIPAKVKGTTKDEGKEELRELQGKIERAGRIAVVGGGPVGVQLSGDIKSWYGEKEVVIFHSRERLLTNFGGKLSQFVEGRFEEMGIMVLLEERPQIPRQREGNVEIILKSGKIKTFDLLIPCTGLKPNSSIISSLAPDSISPTTGRILVKPTLQIEGSKSASNSNIFALGDVAETHGAKMARAGMAQAEIVQTNILSLIKGKKVLKKYIPNFAEGSLKLSLGKTGTAIYMQDGDEEFLIPSKPEGEDLSVKQAWWMFGVNIKDADK